MAANKGRAVTSKEVIPNNKMLEGGPRNLWPQDKAPGTLTQQRTRTMRAKKPTKATWSKDGDQDMSITNSKYNIQPTMIRLRCNQSPQNSARHRQSKRAKGHPPYPK